MAAKKPAKKSAKKPVTKQAKKSAKKPATKARVGTNPFTGEQMTFKAKPASKAVRVRPVKALKELV